MQDLKIATSAGLITIGGANTLTLGAGGFSVSNDTIGLAMEAVVAIAVEQARSEASMQKLAVKGGADVSLSKIGMGDLTLSGANMFAATKVIEEQPLNVPASLKGTKVGKLAYPEFGILKIGPASIASLRLERARRDAGSGVLRGTNRGGRGTVRVSSRSIRSEGAKEKAATYGESAQEFAAALKLPHGAGPMVSAEAAVVLPENNEMVPVNGGALSNITANNITANNITANNVTIAENNRIPRTARNLVSPPAPDYATYTNYLITSV